MQDQDGQYKPQDKNIDLDDLVCPKCGTDVPKEQYNEVTQLIKCQDCGNIFVFTGVNDMGESKADLLTETSLEGDVNEVIKPKMNPSFIFISLLLLLAILILWYLKGKG